MGFMSYTLVGSDNAADMANKIFSTQLKNLKSELRRRDNQYNTDGYMNVSMYIREILMKQAAHLKTWDREGYTELADLCMERLKLELERLNKLKADNSADAKWVKSTLMEVRKMISAVERFKKELR